MRFSSRSRYVFEILEARCLLSLVAPTDVAVEVVHDSFPEHLRFAVVTFTDNNVGQSHTYQVQWSADDGATFPPENVFSPDQIIGDDVRARQLLDAVHVFTSSMPVLTN